ncbi:MAG: CRISPR-associated endonuclease Cas3'' [Lachnospiraceae bacterium]|nr:CRISPR-associated endonuclease Cas3'' [Lachnospiraceae bacterium]
MQDCYFARSANACGEMETLAHHSQRVSSLCGEFLKPLGYTEIGKVLGGLHDFGKASKRFAEVLEGKRIHVNHAYPGAALAYVRYNQKKTARIIASVIAAHHSYLDSGCIPRLKELMQGTGSGCDEEGNTYSLFGMEEMKKALEAFQAESPQLMQIKIPQPLPDEEDPVADMLLARFLLSALADADYSASAEHFEPDYLKKHSGTAFHPEEAMKRLLQIRTEKRQLSTSSAALNILRDQLFEDCLCAAEAPPGLFTLTAPTGLGKTLSLFAFAVRHCMKYGQMRRIILILPYLAIMEQNVRDYRRVMPELLESHSAAVLDERARNLLERWDAPCIVTTNVGFFEPLFSARPTGCRHLHQLADSVIVLDEAQSLPPELLDATLRTVNLLCNQYGCTVVFSTATQPSYQHLPGMQWKPTEIVPHPEELFQATRRVTYDWRIERPVSYRQIAKELVSCRQGCVIVNLRSHAEKLFHVLKETLCKAEAEGLFYLTGDLCGAHRSRVLDEIKERLADGKSCYLVASQCIEAGVDLDFPVVYRALAPLESIIQAAGRCNRNGDSPEGRVIVFLPDEECLYPSGAYYQRAAVCVKTLASRHPIDCCNLRHVEEYYEILYSNAEGDKEKLKKALWDRDYQKVQEAYKLIESRGVQVIVPWKSEMELFRSVQEEYSKTGLTQDLIRRARPLTASSFAEDKVQECCIPLFFRTYGREREVKTEWYLLGNPECYHEKLGLNFGALETFDGMY